MSPHLRALLRGDDCGDALLRQGLATLRRRSKHLAPLVQALGRAAAAGVLAASVEDLAGSFVHMHANRVLRSAARAQELVLYDHLARLYDSQSKRRSD